METTPKRDDGNEIREHEANAVSGGDGELSCPTPPEQTDPGNPIWKALQDAWNGLVN